MFSRVKVALVGSDAGVCLVDCDIDGLSAPASVFEGIVLHGEKIGRTIGFPTANIALQGARPDTGVYAAHVELEDGRAYFAIAYYGRRPTVDGRGELLEVFLFDFGEEIYGARLRVELVRLIRGCRKFGSLDEMKIQIGRDCERALEIISFGN